MVVILGKGHLTKEQITKIFSNPVSGIYAEFHPYDLNDENINHISRIRYSKSMMVRAITFWTEYYYNFVKKLERLNSNELFKDVIGKANEQYWNLLGEYVRVNNYPDTFLFSHRYISKITIPKENTGLIYQGDILGKKHKKNIAFQERSLDPFWYVDTDVSIGFTVFPNEHPYIPRQKISKVGMTDKGNLYVLHKKKK